MDNTEKLARKTSQATLGVGKTWIKIETGTFKSAKLLGEKITSEKCNIEYNAMQALNRIPLSRHKKKIKLAKVLISDLGLPEGGTMNEVFKKAKQIGLITCPAEVGPLLRLRYKKQPKDECIRIAMNPIVNIDEEGFIFCISHYAEGLTLEAEEVELNEAYVDSRECFVFQKKR